jgi:hypothetical protein
VRVLVELEVTAKDECEQGAGSLPLPGEVAHQIADDLHYQTRDDPSLPWRVTAVREV